MKHIKVLIITGIFVSLCFMSVGFAAFSRNLSIDEIMASVIGGRDIKLKDASVSSSNSGALITYLEHDENSTSFGISLPNPDSYVILDLDLINLGNEVMGIKRLTGLNSNLKYEMMNYTEGTKICDDVNPTVCKNGSESHALVKISYKDDTYDSANYTFSTGFNIDFKKVYTVSYGNKIKEKFITPGVNEIMDGERFELEVDITDITEIYAVMNKVNLVRDSEYTLVNNVLTIPSATGDISIDYIEKSTGGNVSSSSEWIDEYTVEITLNGKSSTDLYIRVYKNDLFVGNSGSNIYVKEYAQNPMFKAGQTVFVQYEPISGTANLTKSFTIKLRDTSTACGALNTAELIAQTTNKTNFYIDSVGRNEGTLSVNSSYISVFSSTGNTFNDFKFRIKFGVVS